ncbi:EcsC family protein [Cellulomonas marina]|uniref:EcsC protein family protein n=1 Tax=Cellulomonas marina TaxID=988821 RepID=A0A1I1A5T9_9CELL|nr:EcsC family protein [Cellulomonas marina]GIG29580.1 hypothetical protein Cma02nite_21800 [Cellulomonas marina]SFB33329.1 EcsC protein family protein [Cellulomonas marina]
MSQTPDDKAVVQKILDQIIGWGVDGLGPIKGAQQIADEHLATHGDAEVAIRRIIATHTRIVAATGFASGFGGITVAAVTIPADVTAFYVNAARCAAAVAALRGYDINSDEVRSVVLLTLLGSAGASIVADLGVQLGTKAAIAALKKLPGKVLIEINKAVGFRLLTKFGTRGVINLARFIPLVGAGVGAGVNVTAMRGVGIYARINFPVLTSSRSGAEPPVPPEDGVMA